MRVDEVRRQLAAAVAVEDGARDGDDEDKAAVAEASGDDMGIVGARGEVAGRAGHGPAGGTAGVVDGNQTVVAAEYRPAAAVAAEQTP